MAHFARIHDGTVTEVIVVHDADAPDEATGQAFIASIGLDGEWVQTSYTASMRGKYAGIRDTWDGSDFSTSNVEPAP